MKRDDPLCFNGIDAATGAYLQPPMAVAELSRAILGRRADVDRTELLERRLEALDRRHLGTMEGVDPLDLADSGWGVVFGKGVDPAVEEALAPLVEHRRRAASARDERRFRRIEHLAGESVWQFLDRHQAGWGPVNPDKLPYYLLLVGGPESIPFDFQYDLDLEHAVGRIAFATPEEYAAYAAAVLEAEARGPLPRSTAAFFATHNPDDKATELSCELLVKPLLKRCREGFPQWELTEHLAAAATKETLGEILGGKDTPAFLMSASHGVAYQHGDRRQRERQGAVLCQDWPGPKRWQRESLAAEHVFAADDLASDVRLQGMIALHFGCYGAGTRAFATFPVDQRHPAAECDFVARLPQRLLAQGALAVVAHVDQAWGYSYLGEKGGLRLETFESTLRALLAGHPVGSAMDDFGRVHATRAAILGRELQAVQRHGKRPDDDELVRSATACEDARNYVVLGDPAVRLPVAALDREGWPQGSPERGDAPAAAAAPALVLAEPRAPAREPAPPVRERPLRVLAAVASPADLESYALAEIAAEREHTALAEALARAVEVGLVEVKRLEPPVSLERLSEELRWWRPHVLYLVAHGRLDPENGGALLFLEGRDRKVKVERGERFVELVEGLREPPRLVHLSSCESAAAANGRAFCGVGPGLERAGVSAVLAMQGKVPIDTARDLTRTFYRELLLHGRVDEAWQQARLQLKAAELPGESSPVLFADLVDGRLFDFGAFDLGAYREHLRTELTDVKARYVPLAVHRVAWAESRWQGAAEELELAELERHRCAVLLGDAGAGKSTALALLARACLDAVDGPVRLPLRLQLRGYPEVGDERASPEERLLKLIGQVLRRQGAVAAEPPPAEVRTLLELAQPLAILCDGLSEVPADERAGVRRAVVELAARHRRHRWLLTSRPQDFPQLAEWEHFAIAPLDDQRMRDLLLRATGDEAAAGEIFEVARSAGGALLRSPLFLTFAVRQRQNLALLAQSAASVSALLRGYTDHLLAECSSPPAAKEALLRLAACARGRPTVPREQLNGVEDALVDELCDHGLLAREGDGRLRFRHPTLQEYFSAGDFVARWRVDGRLQQKAPAAILEEMARPDAEGTLVLAVAHLDAEELPTALQTAVRKNLRLAASWVDDPDVERRWPGAVDIFVAEMEECAHRALRHSWVRSLARRVRLHRLWRELRWLDRLIETVGPQAFALGVAVILILLVLTFVPRPHNGWIAPIIALVAFVVVRYLIRDYSRSVAAKLETFFSCVSDLRNTELQQRLRHIQEKVRSHWLTSGDLREAADLEFNGVAELVRKLRESRRQKARIVDLATYRSDLILPLMRHLTSYGNELTRSALEALEARAARFPGEREAVVCILKESSAKLGGTGFEHCARRSLRELGEATPASSQPLLIRICRNRWRRFRSCRAVDWQALEDELSTHESRVREALARPAGAAAAPGSVSVG